MHFAEAALFMTIATILATAKIEKALDDDGKVITPKLAFNGGLVR